MLTITTRNAHFLLSLTICFVLLSLCQPANANTCDGRSKFERSKDLMHWVFHVYGGKISLEEAIEKISPYLFDCSRSLRLEAASWIVKIHFDYGIPFPSDSSARVKIVKITIKGNILVDEHVQYFPEALKLGIFNPNELVSILTGAKKLSTRQEVFKYLVKSNADKSLFVDLLYKESESKNLQQARYSFRLLSKLDLSDIEKEKLARTILAKVSDYESPFYGDTHLISSLFGMGKISDETIEATEKLIVSLDNPGTKLSDIHLLNDNLKRYKKYLEFGVPYVHREDRPENREIIDEIPSCKSARWEACKAIASELTADEIYRLTREIRYKFDGSRMMNPPKDANDITDEMIRLASFKGNIQAGMELVREAEYRGDYKQAIQYYERIAAQAKKQGFDLEYENPEIQINKIKKTVKKGRNETIMFVLFLTVALIPIIIKGIETRGSSEPGVLRNAIVPDILALLPLGLAFFLWMGTRGALAHPMLFKLGLNYLHLLLIFVVGAIVQIISSFIFKGHRLYRIISMLVCVVGAGYVLVLGLIVSAMFQGF